MKKDLFPIFNNNHEKFAYLDNAATTHKPQSVLDSLMYFYTTLNSNVHRSVYLLGEKATEVYENSRDVVASFIKASDRREIIFTKSTTESVNLVAYSWGEANISVGDEIVVSILEHHSNYLPWEQLAKRKKAILKIIPLGKNNDITIENVRSCLSNKTKIVAITHISNVTGTITPVKDITREAHAVGALVLVDAAQSIAHVPIDVKDLDCDWLVFSGHKMYGPTGVAVLYGKKNILESMPPFLFGGGMVRDITNEKIEWAELPNKFEAGTPSIAEVVVLGTAIKFLEKIGFDSIIQHERELTTYAFQKLKTIEKVITVGSPGLAAQGAIISFVVEGSHPHDIASLLGEYGVCVRAGHHCAAPLHSYLNIQASCRLSLAIYNSKEDIDMLIDGLKYAKKTLKI